MQRHIADGHILEEIHDHARTFVPSSLGMVRIEEPLLATDIADFGYSLALRSFACMGSRPSVSDVTRLAPSLRRDHLLAFGVFRADDGLHARGSVIVAQQRAP